MRESFLINALRSMRPSQWVKNFIIFAALIFSQKVLNPDLILKTLWAFLLFCVLSAGTYIFNDLVDRKKDRLHPLKAKRPIATGKISFSSALILGLVLIAIFFVFALILNKTFALVGGIYFVFNLAYSLYLKNLVIIDVMIVSLGFVWRALAGAVIIQVEFSAWLLIATLLLALFLAFGKRRHELTLLNNEAVSHRPILKEYSPYLLDQMIVVVAAAVVIVYILYATSQEVIARLGTYNLIFTSPFVFYGILRYLYLIHQKEKGGSPTQTLLTDPPLIINIFLWVAAVIIIIYLYK